MSIKRNSPEYDFTLRHFAEYPDFFKKLMADNNYYQRNSYDSIEEAFFKENKHASFINKFIYVGKNTKKLITDITKVTGNIKIVKIQGTRYCTMRLNDCSGDFNNTPTPSSDHVLVNCETNYEGKKLKFTVCYCPSYTHEDVRFERYVHTNRGEAFDKFMAMINEAKELGNKNNPETKLENLEPFIRMCRGLNAKSIYETV